MAGTVSRAAALFVLLQLAQTTSSAHAQFEEPDTVSPFSIGVFGEVFSRGKSGTAETLGGPVDVSLSGGPAIGARLEYRILETVTVGVKASYAAPGEKQKGETSEVIAPDGFTELRFAAELLLKIKRSVPGFFALGGGARYINPKGKEPETQFTGLDSFTEGFGLLGAGVDVVSRRSVSVRVDFRVYLIVPAKQEAYDVKSLSTDLSLGLGVLFRI